MAKIRFESWKEEIPVTKYLTGYRVDGLEWYKTSSSHGRSQGEVKCPCCGYTTQIYIWSFRGSGKRCGGCNVFLGSMGAFLSIDEVTSQIEIGHDLIKVKR